MAKIKSKEKENTLLNAKQVMNAMSDFCSNLIPQFGGNTNGPINELSSTDTLYFNLRWYLISNYRQLISELYVEHGIVQTLVDQPVDDAFRAGFELKTSQLEPDEIEQVQIYMQRHRVTHAIKQAKKWGRLYGGGAILIITDQDPATPFRIESVKQESQLEFRPVDMWELFADAVNIEGEITPGGALGADASEFYNYYGHRIHNSRVFKVVGKEPPAFIRPRLRGWGMSELEKVVRSLNQYMRNQDVVFALLNEAKVDVFRINEFNESVMTSAGSQKVQTRVGIANMIKNYMNCLMLDKEDEYEQKQITFAGLAEVLAQIRQGIAADLKMPITKLFGISASGFNSGEDDIENYNSMLEGEIREPTQFIVLDMIEIVCYKLFGTAPTDLIIQFNPLRILSAEEEEKVKDYQFNRVVKTFEDGLATAQEAKQAINRDSLLGIELDETSDALPPVGQNMTETATDGKVEK
jgi:phage-related protein (TIGR01555 family)